MQKFNLFSSCCMSLSIGGKVLSIYRKTIVSKACLKPRFSIIHFFMHHAQKPNEHCLCSIPGVFSSYESLIVSIGQRFSLKFSKTNARADEFERYANHHSVPRKCFMIMQLVTISLHLKKKFSFLSKTSMKNFQKFRIFEVILQIGIMYSFFCKRGQNEFLLFVESSKRGLLAQI